MANPTNQPPKENASDRSSLEYSSDHPIGRPEEDRFDRWPFVQRVANTIRQRRDSSSLVIGIYGPWGDGKTSVLRLLAHALGRDSSIILVRYNPWYFRDVSQLLKGFFDTLADTLQESISTIDPSRWSRWRRRAEGSKETVGTILKKYGKLLSLVSTPLGEAAVGLGESLSSEEIEALRDRLGKILHDAGKRVVVLIDDIDRLDNKEVRAVLKLVKLSANFEYVTYILAFDDEIVATSLGEAYGGGGTAAGVRFLEKIVQVALHLPRADASELRRLALEGVDEALRLAEIQLTETQINEFVRHFVIGFEPALKTPRQAKRLQNALTFALPLLRGEVNPVDQLLIESLRVFYPQSYVTIRDNSDVFLRTGKEVYRAESPEGRQRARGIIELGMANLGGEEQEGVKNVLQALFPRVKGILANSAYEPRAVSEWESEKRICSESYFWRYFRYTVPSGDMKDTALDLVLINAKDGKETDVKNALLEAAEHGAVAKLIQKLEQRAPEVDSDAAAFLLGVLARHGHLFPHERGSLAAVTEPFVRAAILVRKLMKRVQPVERSALATELMEKGRPVSFAVECFRWLQPDKDSQEDRLLPEDIEARLGQLLAKRIREEAQEEPPYSRYPQRGALLLSLWKHYGDAVEVSTYLEKRFSSHPDEVTRFLSSFTGTAWSMETGLPSRTDFSEDAYKSATSYVPADVLVPILRSQFGEDLGEGNYYTSSDTPSDRHIAHQFAFLARRAATNPDDTNKS